MRTWCNIVTRKKFCGGRGPQFKPKHLVHYPRVNSSRWRLVIVKVEIRAPEAGGFEGLWEGAPGIDMCHDVSCIHCIPFYIFVYTLQRGLYTKRCVIYIVGMKVGTLREREREREREKETKGINKEHKKERKEGRKEGKNLERLEEKNRTEENRKERKRERGREEGCPVCAS